MKKHIQGLELYSYDEVVGLVKEFIEETLYNNGYSANDVIIHDIRLHGSRLRGQAKENSDLDAVVEYSGNIREDDFFNMLHDEPMFIDEIEVDVNPITSNMNDYMKKSDDYDRHKLKEVL